MRIRSFLIAYVFLTIPCIVFSQETATLKGVVTDLNGRHLEYVSILVAGIANPISTHTNSKGEYALVLPAQTELNIEFLLIGYVKQSTSFILESGEVRIMNEMLSARSIKMPSTEVKGERLTSLGSTSLEVEKIKIVSIPNEGIEALFKSFAGISTKDEMSSQYSVRGGSFDENMVYINGVEIQRPFLVRSGQQEGLSIVNPDMTGDISFSTGGFGVQYGDKLSSVLDITYKKARQFGGTASASLLGASFYVEDLIKNKISYNIGFRQHSNRYLLKTLDKKGDYRPSFTDLQGYFHYPVNTKLEMSFFGIFSQNIYQLIPVSQETVFGDMFQPTKLKVYFDGEEKDKYQTFLGSFSSTYFPNDETRIWFGLSAYKMNERETFDIKSDYWLNQVSGAEESDPVINLGIGSYTEHARNYLQMRSIQSELKVSHLFSLGSLEWGVKYQNEIVSDRQNEWKIVDSSGYTIPVPSEIPGEDNPSQPPSMQDVLKSTNQLSTNRFGGFVLKNWSFFNQNEDQFNLQTGVRMLYWSYNEEFLVSPRIHFSFKPNKERKWVYRISTGVYSQSPSYREFRYLTGVLNPDIKAQKSLQLVGGVDYPFQLWDRPFKFTTELYYKYITDLISYKVDNLRIVYSGKNDGVGYATGIEFRLNGEFVKDMESWISVSLMQTQEKSKNSTTGYYPRPTDQRFIFNMFFQDYVPSLPWLKMNVLVTFGSGIPFTKPNQQDMAVVRRLPAYMRADWGTSLRLKEIVTHWETNKVLRLIKEAWLSFEIFNLFDNHNVISYLWVSDYENRQYAVPNFLTSRQLNVKLRVDF